MEPDPNSHQEAVRQSLPSSQIANCASAACTIAPAPVPPSVLVAEVATDGMLVALWLHGRGPHTIRAYRFEVERFRKFIWPTELRALRLKNVQDYLDSIAQLSPNSQRRAQATLKSLFSFGVGVRYLPVNLGLFLRPVTAKNTLSERILDESAVQAIIAREELPRNRVMLRLLYAAGLRVSEICALKWRNIQERGETGQITIFGKGGKTRVIVLSTPTFRALQALDHASSPEAPIFSSRKGGGHLHPSRVLRIVKAAAARAGVSEASAISPHWFRHAHASHALERGCPISLVQATLGHASVSTTGRYLHARPGDSSAKYLGV